MLIKPALFCVFLLLVVALGAMAQSAPPSSDPVVAKALAIHQRALTLDTHVDIGGANYATPALDRGGTTTLKCDLTKM